jgi:hypothetical protein
MITLASRRLWNASMFRHSSRSRPLKLSTIPFCHGEPGSTYSVATPCDSKWLRSLDASSSGPLSERM